MKINRRNFLQCFLGMMAGLKGTAGAVSDPEKIRQERFVPVETPDIPKLPYEIQDGVKVFHLVAEPVKREFLPGKVVDVWGYSGSMPGPTIEVMEGDHVRIIFENKLPEATTVHWHGVEVPLEMDGVPAISQKTVMPGQSYTYEFTLHQNGTFFYHSHMAMQEMMGMIGLFIIHPKKPHNPPVDRDFGLVLQEWAILPNNTVPNSMSMEFNWLTFNGKAGPATTPLLVKHGERVRIRMVNLGMDHHPIHIHGHQFTVTGTEAGRIPESAWYQENTVLVGVAQARDIEFKAKYIGDWMLHCHLPHHMMNQMVSMVGPVAHPGMGMQTGMGMEEGMGIVRQGHALSEELGPGLGRGMGIETREKLISNLVGQKEMVHGEHVPHEMKKKRVPGFPQDHWMPMDEAVAKPETHGLVPEWSGAVQGMMTLVRILPPDKYEEIVKRITKEKTGTPEKDFTPHTPETH
ncbi:MAG: copper oxidase [Nitrospirota bacterium]